MLLVIENCSLSDYLMVETRLSYSDSFRYSRDSLTARDYIPPRYRQLIFIVESTSQHQSRNYPTYDLTYQHTAHATGTKSIINKNSDDLHRPRLCSANSIP